MDRPPRATLSFPTRRYAASMLESAETLDRLKDARLYAFVLGIDAAPREMTAAERDDLSDPLASLLLRQGIFPRTAQALLTALDALGADGLPAQKSFLAGDGAQLDLNGSAVDRLLRYVVTRSGPGRPHALLISTGTDLASLHAFLQVAAWDARNRWFNYYQRQDGAWVWSGNSLHALDPSSRGRGPFDSHVNGSLVMKERKPPWMHWHSMSASIHASADPRLAGSPLFEARQSADVLQLEVVEPGIRRWNRARIEHFTTPDGMLRDVPGFLRQVLDTTTINLASTPHESRLVQPEDTLLLPIGFFLNAEAFFDVLELPAGILATPRARGADYLRTLADYGIGLVDGASGFRQPGDTFFAFAVPEPAFEDLDVLTVLLERGVLTRRLAATLLMVDFPNPVDSERRKALLAYVPETAPLAGEPSLSTRLSESILAATEASPEGSPERELAALWAHGEGGWEAAFAGRLHAYLAAVTARAATPEGFDDYARLAESRRRRARKRDVLEFDLTLPTTNIPRDAPMLRMRENGSIEPAPPLQEPI